MSKFFFSTPFSGEIAYHPIILPTSSKGSPQLDRDLLSPKSLSGESCSTKSNSSSNWSPSGRRMSHETLSSSGGDSGFFNVPTPPGTFLISFAKSVNCLCNSPEFFFLQSSNYTRPYFCKANFIFHAPVFLPEQVLSRQEGERKNKCLLRSQIFPNKYFFDKFAFSTLWV